MMDRCHMWTDPGKNDSCYFGDNDYLLVTESFFSDCHHKFAFLGQRDQIRFWQKWNVQFLETWNSDLLILFLLPFLYSTPFHLLPRCSGADENFDDSYSLSYWSLPGGALGRANHSTRWKHRFEICLWWNFSIRFKAQKKNSTWLTTPLVTHLMTS